MDPTCKVPDAGIGAHECRLGDAGARRLPDKFPSDRCVPLLRPIVAVEFCVEQKEAAEVASLGFDGRRRLFGDLGYEVRARECAETVFALRKELRNIMLLIMCGNEPTIGHVFRNRPSAPKRLSDT